MVYEGRTCRPSFAFLSGLELLELLLQFLDGQALKGGVLLAFKDSLELIRVGAALGSPDCLLLLGDLGLIHELDDVKLGLGDLVARV